MKPRFPHQLTPEFLFVDLLNNLDELAEDRDDVLGHARTLWPARVSTKLLQAVELYGNAATRKHIKAWMDAETALNQRVRCGSQAEPI